MVMAAGRRAGAGGARCRGRVPAQPWAPVRWSFHGPTFGLVAELLEGVGLRGLGPALPGSANTTWFTTSATHR